MDRGRLVHRDHAERLVTLGALNALDNDAGAFIGSLEAVAPKHGNVQEHVRPAVVGNDEAVAFGSVEPFDDAVDLDEIGAGLTEPAERTERAVAPAAAVFARRDPPGRYSLPGNPELLGLKSVRRPHNPGPHTAMQPATSAALESRVLRECSQLDATRIFRLKR